MCSMVILLLECIYKIVRIICLDELNKVCLVKNDERYLFKVLIWGK